VEGASRFLNRLWRFVQSQLDVLGRAPRVAPAALSGPGRAFRRTVHQTIDRVTRDIERDFGFNTAISAVMELVNALVDFERIALDTMGAEERAALLREGVETTLLLLGPVCPHLAEELWSTLGHRESLFRHPWPTADPAAIVRDEVEIVVQVDGKVRGRVVAGAAAPDAEVRDLALADGKVQPWLSGRQVAKVVVVPGRLVNIVTRA
jgi:leucyl-tRNA synthetase